MTDELRTVGGLEDSLGKALHGCAAAWPATLQTMMIDGTEYTLAEVQAKLQEPLTKIAAEEVSRIQHDKDLAARVAAEPGARAFLSAFYRSLPVYFGHDNATLEQFGKELPKERQPPTVEQKQHAVAQAKATRAARGTKGAKQKAAIKGVVKP